MKDNQSMKSGGTTSVATASPNIIIGLPSNTPLTYCTRRLANQESLANECGTKRERSHEAIVFQSPKVVTGHSHSFI